ncbi:MAG: asparaginase [Sulfobacillus sp.]
MPILYLGLGGTIACTFGPDHLVRSTLGAGELLAQIDGGADTMAEDLGMTASSDLTFADLLALAGRIRRAFEQEGYTGCVISQGTDTIEEVAYTLHLLHAWPHPVVITGAMRHADLPGKDGPANLQDALAVARAPEAVGLGVLVVMGGEIHGASAVTKSHSQRPSTFASPDWGPLGLVAEGSVLIARRISPPPLLPATEISARVNLIRVPLDVDLALVEAALAGDGLVLEGTGGGHLPAKLGPLLRRSVQAGKVVAVTSRTGSGPSLRHTYGAVGAESDLQKLGILIADGPGLKVRIRLTLALSLHPRPDLASVLAAWL